MGAGDVLESESGVTVKPSSDAAYRAARNGPFTTLQLTRISDALTAANSETGLQFSVYVGPLQWPLSGELDSYESDADDLSSATHAARAMHNQLSRRDDAVLVAVSPNERVVDIVTGQNAAKRLNDRTCGLAVASAVSSFSVGDLTNGIVSALRMLTDRAAE